MTGSSAFGGRPLLIALFLGSVLSTGAGMFALTRFDNTVGIQEEAPASWPAQSTIQREAGKDTVLVFAHPMCPCTRATLYELEETLASFSPAASGPSVRILFIRPADEGWTNADAWGQAASIRGSVVRWDNGGAEATRFHAGTSGQVLLYNPQGRLLFRGESQRLVGMRATTLAVTTSRLLFTHICPLEMARLYSAVP